MSKTITSPSPSKRRIRINRSSFEQAGAETSETGTDNGSNHGNNTTTPPKSTKNKPIQDELGEPRPKVSRKEAQEAQSKIVDDLFKDFLVQKMAVIEKERQGAESFKEAAERDREKSLEIERKDVEGLMQDPAPFKDFLRQKMALIEKEREAVEQSKEKRKPGKELTAKTQSEAPVKEENSRKSDHKKKHRHREKSTEEPMTNYHKEHKPKERSKVEEKAEHHKEHKTKEKSRVEPMNDHRQEHKANEKAKVEPPEHKTRERSRLESATDHNKDQKATGKSKADPVSEHKKEHKEKYKTEPAAPPETLAQKIAAIEKERKAVEKKAIKEAENGSKKSHKHKSHKKSKKRDKDKDRDSRRSKRYSRSRSRSRSLSLSDSLSLSLSRSRSRSRSRERSRERKRKHKHRYNDRDRSEERALPRRDRSKSDSGKTIIYLSGQKKPKDEKPKTTDDATAPLKPSTLSSIELKKPTEAHCDNKNSDNKKDAAPEKIKVSGKEVHRQVSAGESHNFTVTIGRPGTSKPEVKKEAKDSNKAPIVTPTVVPPATQRMRTINTDPPPLPPPPPPPPLPVHSKVSEHSDSKPETVDPIQSKLLAISMGSVLPVKVEEHKPPAAFEAVEPVVKAAEGAVDKGITIAGAGDEQKGKSKGPLKLGLKLGIKISQTSTELIQSGRRVDLEGKADNLEEGEIDDSEGVVSAELSSEISSDMSSTLSLTEDEDQGSVSSSKKRKKKKSKHKKKKKKHKVDKDGKRKDSTKSKSSKKRESRSRSRSGSRSRSRSRSRRRSRSRSSSRERDRNRRGGSGFWRDSDRYRSREYLRDRWPAGGRGHSGPAGGRFGRRSRSRDRDRGGTRAGEDLRLKIDKAKLREIAIANAYANMQTGQGPPMTLKPDDIARIKAGGKSIADLTDFCKKIAQKEGAGDSSSDSDMMGKLSDDDAEGPFIHHPFKVREQPNIVLNIRNAKQLPTLSPAEKMAQSSTLRIQFPVSSGSHHRDNENEWVPVQKPSQSESKDKASKDKSSSAPPAAAAAPVPPLPPPPPPPTTLGLNAIAPPPPPPPKDSIFTEPSPIPINIGAIVSERLSALRKLQDNPHDVVAIGTMYKAQKQMNEWAASKQLPGQFTGTTGVQVLTQQELSGTDKHKQAWIKKDQFIRAAPVKSGIGMYLLQKMGWKQGEGLGKNSEGSTEPLLLELKTDRKGLTSTGENSRKNPPPPVVKDLAGKHPVSALVELCTKRRWGSPDFIVVHESGPDHKKNFLYKVMVNNTEYQATLASTNKKLAKAQAATVCLQDLGLVPRNLSSIPPAGTTLHVGATSGPPPPLMGHGGPRYQGPPGGSAPPRGPRPPGPSGLMQPPPPPPPGCI